MTFVAVLLLVVGFGLIVYNTIELVKAVKTRNKNTACSDNNDGKE